MCAATESPAAIVTGASSGIGLSIATVLAQEGYDLTITARGKERLQRAANYLREMGTEVEAISANMAIEDDVIDLVHNHRQRFGRLDVLVNNAGIGVRGPIDTFSTKHIDLMLAVNLKAIVVAYREAVDLLRAAGSKHGRALVVNTASISGKVGTSELGVYAATKHGVVGFTDSMNRELYADGIRSSVLCPGFVDTPLSDYAKADIPPREMIQSSDVAEAVRFLLRLSPSCLVPEIVMMQGEALGLQQVSLDGRDSERIP